MLPEQGKCMRFRKHGHIMYYPCISLLTNLYCFVQNHKMFIDGTEPAQCHIHRLDLIAQTFMET